MSDHDDEVYKYTLSFSQPAVMDPGNTAIHVQPSEEGTTIQHISEGGAATPPMDPHNALQQMDGPVNSEMMEFQMRHSMSGSQKNSVIVEEDEEDHESI